MQAAHLTATEAAKVTKKNAAPIMGSVLRLFLPNLRTRSCAALQQKPITVLFFV